ncbi:phosphoenolpyruvate--protein phosphotransferase, partial [Aduncisulcus paluster]
LLAVKNGETITVTATGPDAQQAIKGLKALHAETFGERDEDVAEVVMETEPCKVGGEGFVSGAPASTGYAVGPVYAHLATLPKVERVEVSDTDAEANRLDQAIATALADIEALQRET